MPKLNENDIDSLKSCPIGIFDSGLGGLTVASELQNLLPNESIVYFGDTGRVPYGIRTRQTLTKYINQDINFLLSKKVKLIVAACGTASSVISEQTIQNLPVAYTGVVLPTAQAAVKISKTKKIGVIATSATVKSGSFERAMKQYDPNVEVLSNACPLLVNLVENGYTDFDNEATRIIAHNYLKPFINDRQIDTLILGCTHFPVLSDIIADILGERVTLVNPGLEVSRHVKKMLEQSGLQNDSGSVKAEFYVSDDADGFRYNAQLILSNEVCTSADKIDIDAY